jgi:hypothetical protein
MMLRKRRRMKRLQNWRRNMKLLKPKSRRRMKLLRPNSTIKTRKGIKMMKMYRRKEMKSRMTSKINLKRWKELTRTVQRTVIWNKTQKSSWLKNASGWPWKKN